MKCTFLVFRKISENITSSRMLLEILISPGSCVLKVNTHRIRVKDMPVFQTKTQAQSVDVIPAQIPMIFPEKPHPFL